MEFCIVCQFQKQLESYHFSFINAHALRRFLEFSKDLFLQYTDKLFQTHDTFGNTRTPRDLTNSPSSVIAILLQSFSHLLFPFTWNCARSGQSQEMIPWFLLYYYTLGLCSDLSVVEVACHFISMNADVTFGDLLTAGKWEVSPPFLQYSI